MNESVSPEIEISLVRRSQECPPAGIYKVVLENVKSGVSDNGNETLYWRGAICDGEWAGYPLFFQLVLIPSARWKVDEFLDAVKAPDTGSANPRAFVGTIIGAACAPEYWQGKPRLKIQSYLPLKDEPAKVVDKADMIKLVDLFQATTTATVPDSVDKVSKLDDDIPF